MEAAAAALTKSNLARAHSFTDLYNRVESAVDHIAMIGPLTIYDIAHRIGAYLGLEPQEVYLHAGTLEGAQALGFRSSMLRKGDLPRAFQRLSAAEIEDCLCIFKDDLKEALRRGNPPLPLKEAHMAEIMRPARCSILISRGLSRPKARQRT